MPTYEYACRSCGAHLEVVQSFHDAALTECGSCGGPLRKVFSAAGLIFKGSGWHVKDYAPSRAPASTGPTTSSSDTASTSTPGSGTPGGSDAGGASGASTGGSATSGSAAPATPAAPAAAAG